MSAKSHRMMEWSLKMANSAPQGISASRGESKILWRHLPRSQSSDYFSIAIAIRSVFTMVTNRWKFPELVTTPYIHRGGQMFSHRWITLTINQNGKMYRFSPYGKAYNGQCFLQSVCSRLCGLRSFVTDTLWWLTADTMDMAPNHT